MPLKSEERIRQELIWRQRLVAASSNSQTTYASSVALASHSALRQLHAELENVGDGVDWSIDGPAVHGHAMEFRYLAPYSQAIGRTFRHTTRDIMLLEGMKPLPGVAIKDLVEPVAVGFNGSFGLRIGGSTAPQQITLFGSLFDRTAEKVVGVLSASADIDAGQHILDNLSGLRRRSLAALTALCTLTLESGHVSTVRWRGATPFTFDQPEAEVLGSTLAEVVPSEKVIVVEAELETGSRDTGRFHLIERGESPRHFRGKPEPGATVTLRGIPVGASVRATLLVIELDSPLLDEPKREYLLRSIERLPD